MRLIDADALLARVPKCDMEMHVMDVKRMIGRVPTVDAVPVVRCRECQKWHTPDCHAGHEQAAADYCSHGKRKGGDPNV